MPTTFLDDAHAAMMDSPEDDTARLRFYRRLADTELFLLLTREPEAEVLDPEILDVDNPETNAPDRYALVFDSEERLSAFATAHKTDALPYAALPGRVIAQSLAGQGVGLALNLDVAPSSILLPAAAMDWLSDTLNATPQPGEGTLVGIAPPTGLPDGLLEGLQEKLVAGVGLASHAVFVKGSYEGGREGWLLAFIDTRPGAESALARATQEALTFSGTELGNIDVAFFDSSDPICEHLDRVGLRYTFPDLEAARAVQAEEDPRPRPAPGSDPDKPPILK